MSENQKAFLVYNDLIKMVRKMPKESAGELLMAMLSFSGGEEYEITDGTVDIIFEGVKSQMERDRAKWDTFRQKQSENGKLGGRPKKANQTQDNPENPSLSGEIQKSLTVTVTDTVKSNKLYTDFIGLFNGLRKTKFKATTKVEKSFNARIKDGFTMEDIIAATKEALVDSYHIETNFKYITPEFMTRADKLDNFLQRSKSIKEDTQPPSHTPPDMANWPEQRIYDWKVKNDPKFKLKYWMAHDSENNTDEEEKRGIYKDYYDQKTLIFKYANVYS